MIAPDIAKLAAQKLVLISGEEVSLRLRTLKELSSWHEANGDPFDQEVVTSTGESLGPAIGAVGTAPFMSDHRIFILRNLLREDIALAKTKAEGLRQLPDSARLILVADEETNESPSQRKEWEKFIKDCGGTVISFSVDPKKAADEIKAEAERLGKQMSPTTARLLFEMTGNSYSVAMEELEKLVLYTEGQDRIQESDVREAAIATREYNVFRLVESLAMGRPAEALRQLLTIESGRAKLNDAAMASIFPQLLRQYRLAFQARAAMDAGSLAAVEADFPTTPNFGKLADWQQRPCKEVARHLTMDQLLAAMDLLADADAKLKGLLPASPDARDVLEQLIIDTQRVISQG